MQFGTICKLLNDNHFYFLKGQISLVDNIFSLPTIYYVLTRKINTVHSLQIQPLKVLKKCQAKVKHDVKVHVSKTVQNILKA